MTSTFGCLPLGGTRVEKLPRLPQVRAIPGHRRDFSARLISCKNNQITRWFGADEMTD